MQMLSVPGKVLFFGSYSVLINDHIALSFAVTDLKGKGVTSYFTTGKRRIVSAQFKIYIEHNYEKFYERSILVEFAYLIGETYLKEKKLWKKDVFINLINSPIFGTIEGKSGLGSSAAVVIAVIRSLFSANGLMCKDYANEIHKLGQITNALFTKKVSSGFDIATCAHDTTIIYKRFYPEIIEIPEGNVNSDKLREIVKVVDKDWQGMFVKQFIVPSEVALLFFNIKDRKTDTIDAVKKVFHWKSLNQIKFNELMNLQNELDAKAIEALKNKDYSAVREYTHKIREIQRELQNNLRKDLNLEDETTFIEPQPVKEIIDILEEEFKDDVIAGKVPGAGGWDGFCFLVKKTDWDPIIKRTIELSKERDISAEYIPLRII
ncbi:MAG: hypothetical protein QW076_05620 [Candidatus Anstonellales archaeon]